MALANYTDLQASVADFLNRDDLTSVIPDFIALAENDLNRKVRHWRMEDRVTALMDTQYTALPNNFVEPIRLILTGTDMSVLEIVGNLELSNQRQLTNDTKGRPRIYAIMDQSIEVYPTPDADYTVEMVYYESIPKLSVNGTNWLLTNFPDAYLYGTLMHSAPYLQEDARLQTWAALYQQAISAINQDAEQAMTSGSGRRIKIRSY